VSAYREPSNLEHQARFGDGGNDLVVGMAGASRKVATHDEGDLRLDPRASPAAATTHRGPR
jgi:hypothetical protein